MPELAPDEALVAVMASSVNFNTVWTSIFEPMATFAFLSRLGKESVWGARHDQPYHIVGSDAAGVVLRVGSAVRLWKPGDAVTVHSNHVDDQDPSAHDDSMLATNQRIWGYETNFGGLGEFSVVKASQLMPKPAHLTWEEAAVNALTNATSYRMLVSPNGAQMTQGQTVLIWGAGSGIGAYACQYVLNGGGTPDRGRVEPRARRGRARDGRRARHRPERGEPPVLEGRHHPGPGGVASSREAHPWARGHRSRDRVRAPRPLHDGRVGVRVPRGGTIITCAATTGFMLEFDNRYLWMNQKTLKGCHYANYREAWEANKLVAKARSTRCCRPCSRSRTPAKRWRRSTTTRTRASSACSCLAQEEGLGVTDPEMRERLLDKITLFRRAG